MTSNESLVRELVSRFRAGDVPGFADLLHEDFVSHNPGVRHDPAATTGKRAFLAYLSTPFGRDLLAGSIETRRVLADADLVAVHNHVTTAHGLELATVDIFRVRDGLVAEHWDVVQALPPDPANPHGMF
ncbi:nuclear transport factor 2 family protein [Pseudonocardia acaciae]|uniref:nuclear transport factor 2 family protein n=1 Tax=Pseudonocardia acaciae TaxID=551276 RepID=UPI000684FC91|nr:nuclear transport factor 2 family protein [Pseudonocardia acaciae]